MTFQPDPDRIVWRLHLAAPPQRVYAALDSDDGRAAFWAESAPEVEGRVRFTFADGTVWDGRVLRREPPRLWSVEYFGSVVEFLLEPDSAGGTDLTMTDHGVSEEHRTEVIAGWLNVLLPLKAHVDFGVDLHNHDRNRTWQQGYADH